MTTGKTIALTRWTFVGKVMSRLFNMLSRPGHIQFSSADQSCPTLCDPMNCRTPGLPVHHLLLEFTQTHVHWVGDAIQRSHPPLSLSPFTFNLSQHQGLFQWVSSSHQVAKVLELQLQRQSFQWIFRVDFLQSWLVWSLCCPRDSQESPPPPQFKSVNSLALSFLMVQLSHNYQKNCSFDYTDLLYSSNN